MGHGKEGSSGAAARANGARKSVHPQEGNFPPKGCERGGPKDPPYRVLDKKRGKGERRKENLRRKDGQQEKTQHPPIVLPLGIRLQS